MRTCLSSQKKIRAYAYSLLLAHALYILSHMRMRMVFVHAPYIQKVPRVPHFSAFHIMCNTHGTKRRLRVKVYSCRHIILFSPHCANHINKSNLTNAWAPPSALNKIYSRKKLRFHLIVKFAQSTLVIRYFHQMQVSLGPM